MNNVKLLAEIKALRAEQRPNSITAERLGDVLEQLADSGLNKDGGVSLGKSAQCASGGGAAIGLNTKVTPNTAGNSLGGAVGYSASTSDGGAVGDSSGSTSGGAMGKGATTGSGGAIGKGASAPGTGGAVGADAVASGAGGAVGSSAKTSAGGAVGQKTVSTTGAAMGNNANASSGAAIGANATTSTGVAVGFNAKCVNVQGDAIDAVQLGTGTNSRPGTVKAYSYPLLNEAGKIENDRFPTDRPRIIVKTVDEWLAPGQYNQVLPLGVVGIANRPRDGVSYGGAPYTIVGDGQSIVSSLLGNYISIVSMKLTSHMDIPIHCLKIRKDGVRIYFFGGTNVLIDRTTIVRSYMGDLKLNFDLPNRQSDMEVNTMSTGYGYYGFYRSNGMGYPPNLIYYNCEANEWISTSSMDVKVPFSTGDYIRWRNQDFRTLEISMVDLTDGQEDLIEDDITFC